MMAKCVELAGWAMNRLLIAAGAAVASLLVAVPAASAAGALPYSWTGWYLGLNGGGGWGNRHADYVANDAASALLFSPAVGGQPTQTSLRTSGALAGLQLGYNWQFLPRFLVGLETDIDLADVNGTGSAPAQVGAGNPATATLAERIKAIGTVRARLGYLMMDNLLVFGTGGFAYANVERSGDYVVTNAGVGIGVPGPPTFVCFAGTSSCFNGSNKAWVTGWALGGGLEYALSPRWTVKAEYLHIDLDGNNVTETATAVFPGSTPPLSTFNANFNRVMVDVVRAGVNFRF
jgi:outer membrane immunogenic protein